MAEHDLERRHVTAETMEAQHKLHCSVGSCCRDVIGVVGGTVEGCLQIP